MSCFKPKIAIIAIAAASLVAIATIIIIQSNGILYDEGYFIPNIHLIAQTGLTKEFLLKITGSPGPTYAVIHSLFSGITGFSVLGIRLINLGLTFLLLLFIFFNAKLLNAESPISITANFILVPIVWVVCGLALTEVPTMLCAMISLNLTLLCFSGTRPMPLRVTLSIAAGLFLSFAILGRSFFLMAVPAAVVCALVSYIQAKPNQTGVAPSKAGGVVINSLNAPFLLIAFLIFTLLLPIRVFLIWHSLAPPTETAVVGANNLSLVPWYGLLSFCYCAFVAIILAPNWFVIDKKTVIATSFASVIFLILNVNKGYFEFAPFLSAAGKFLTPDLFSVYQRAVPALVLFLSFQFFLSSIIRLWQNRHNPVFLFIGLTALFIAFSAIKVKAQFSSRYVAQIVPYFLLLFIPYEKADWPKVARVGIGAALGFMSLYFYYHHH